MPLDRGYEAMVQVGLVARNARKKLRHQFGMIESLLFVGVEVRFGAAQPEKVAVQNHFATREGLALITNQPFQGERKHAVDARIDKPSGLAGLFVQEMRERAIGPDIFAPDN